MIPIPKRPLLHYYGGKHELAKWTISQMPEHRGYCEPFGGSAGVLLQKQRCHTEIYNDLDFEIVNLFQVLRDHPDEILRLIKLTPASRVEFELAYKKTDEPIERARRTIVRSHFSFGGVGTFFKSSSFACGTKINSGSNGGSQWRGFPEVLEVIIERLRGVIIENEPAIKIIERYDDRRMLFYVDPPYVSSTRAADSVYSFEMTDSDQVQLAKQLSKIDGMAIVAGYSSDLYREAFSGWEMVSRKCLDNRSNVKTECLWMRNVVGQSSLFNL